MAFGDRIRKRRVEKKGWTDEDFAAAKERRQKIKNGLKIVSAVVPVPGVSEAAKAGEALATTVRENKDAAPGKKISSILSASTEALDSVIDAAVESPELPDFDGAIGGLLKDPLFRLAAEYGQQLIDRIEEKTGIDIPDELEDDIVEIVMDLLEEVYEELEDKLAEAGGDVVDKALGWFKGLIG